MVVMSTRCQVRVIAEGLGEGAESVTLYHHSDGYPSNMLPLIREGYQQVLKKGDYYLWQGGRPGKVAGFLCAADPGGFEPEEGHELHGDIEWYYVLRVINKTGGSMAEKPEWVVDVYEPPEWGDRPLDESSARHQFWVKPTFDKLHLVEKGINVTEMTEAQVRKKAEQIERKVDEKYGRIHPSSTMRRKSRASPSKSQPGWYREPARHSLAARGVRTRRKW
jgi:hypothetical protein